MKEAHLTRIFTGERGTFGVFAWEGESPLCVTLERPWRGNLQNVSCIPHGRYKCVWYDSQRFGRTIKVTDVSGRYAILFHQGNTWADTKGCIVVGERYTAQGVGSSSAAFNKFIQTVPEAGFYLNIHWGIRP